MQTTHMVDDLLVAHEITSKIFRQNKIYWKQARMITKHEDHLRTVMFMLMMSQFSLVIAFHSWTIVSHLFVSQTEWVERVPLQRLVLEIQPRETSSWRIRRPGTVVRS